MGAHRLRLSGPADREAVAAFLTAHWGSPQMVLCGRLFDLRDFPAIVTEPMGQGLATFDPETGELMSLDADPPGAGIGTSLVEAVAAELKARGHAVMRVTTTNDNLDALRFYQRRGFRLIAVRPGAVEVARRLKPSIPLIGAHGIPIRDEIELERDLG
ncbi:N-acetyltransferase [Inquilinus sp. Marseille-Q2685]|uniref:GNAT family N-acetyltransferase n=1 Tax=Inquilinus sp. Marseille-Q2685 TaxID=2866581 RepID=UPI001CE3E426|nr:GNAT family N-acetyltransferase [Inquilinus sp. Marseille-Q2685]